MSSSDSSSSFISSAAIWDALIWPRYMPVQYWLVAGGVAFGFLSFRRGDFWFDMGMAYLGGAAGALSYPLLLKLYIQSKF